MTAYEMRISDWSSDVCSSDLSRLAADFYSYAIAADGAAAVPLGSHAGPNTAGAISEGGYLGFAEVQYVHMPLPGESLVAFLSDGAFEEIGRASGRERVCQYV